MKKLIALVVFCYVALCLFFGLPMDVTSICPVRFRNKQKAFIIEQAGLTKEEAAKFFPVYFELQEKKKKLNDESWSLMRQGKDDKTTEAQYEEIVAKVCDNRIAADRLDKSYLDRFKRYFPTRRYSLFNARRCVSIGKC